MAAVPQLSDGPNAASDSGGLLFEVFGNGHRHAIGAGEDPDDMEPEVGGLRTVVPLRVLELLAADARRRRRREERDDHDEAVHDLESGAEELEDNEEVVMAEADLGSDDDDEMMADAEEMEAEFDDDEEIDAVMP